MTNLLRFEPKPLYAFNVMFTVDTFVILIKINFTGNFPSPWC